MTSCAEDATTFGQIGRSVPPCSARRGRREVDVEARVPVQPPLDLGVVVGGVVVADEMHLEVCWHLPVDEGGLIHSWSVARHASDVAGQCAREPSRSACVIVPARPFLIGRLRPVEYIDGEHECVQIEAHDVFKFLREVGVVADLERAYQMRLQPVSLPDAPDARGADAQLGRQCPRAPMRGLERAFSRRLADHLGLNRGALRRRWSPRPRRVPLDPGRSLLSKPTPPQAYGLFLCAQLDGDGLVQPTVCRAQDMWARRTSRAGVRGLSTSARVAQSDTVIGGATRGTPIETEAAYNVTYL